MYKCAATGLLDQTIALDTTKYLTNEDAYIAWYTAERGLDYIGRIFHPISEYGLLMVCTVLLSIDDSGFTGH